MVDLNNPPPAGTEPPCLPADWMIRIHGLTLPDCEIRRGDRELVAIFTARFGPLSLQGLTLWRHGDADFYMVPPKISPKREMRTAVFHDRRLSSLISGCAAAAYLRMTGGSTNAA